jgi:hypothetical protein
MSISCNLMHLLCPPSSRDTGLGNTLFQIATQYAIYKKYNLKINIYELKLYCNLLKKFNYDHDIKLFKKIFERYNYENNEINEVIIREGEAYQVEQFVDNYFLERIKNNLNKNIKIEGYFQSHLYFDEYRDDILDLFSIDDISLDYIKNKYSVLFDNNKICISIHIRMNYANCINYNFNYFEKAINYFNERFNNIHFLIFSNNIESISKWFEHQNYTIVTNNIDYIDLGIMSLCKHNIISHSTFSWWGAYLNNNPDKIVTFPKETLKISRGYLFPNIIFEQRLTEFYMPNWISFDTNTLYLY